MRMLRPAINTHESDAFKQRPDLPSMVRGDGDFEKYIRGKDVFDRLVCPRLPTPRLRTIHRLVGQTACPMPAASRHLLHLMFPGQ